MKKHANEVIFLFVSLMLIHYSNAGTINFIQNSDFQSPIVTPAGPKWAKDYPNGITGWNCTRKCQLVSITKACSLNVDLSFCDLTNNSQVLNLQSTFGNEIVTQFIQGLQNGSYLLSFQWISPFIIGTDKSFEIEINGRLIEAITVNISNNQPLKIYKYISVIDIITGQNELKFTMYGPTDGYGVYIDNVQLQQHLIDNSSSIGNTSNNNSSINSSLTNQTSSSSNQNNTIDAINSSNQTGDMPQNTSQNATDNPTQQNTTLVAPNNNSSINSSLTNQTQSSSNESNNLDRINSSNQTGDMPRNTSQQAINDTTQSSTQQDPTLVAISSILMNTMIDNPITSYSNKLPGSRIFLKFILDYFVNFDRLQFYSYHNQNFSYYSQQLLLAINSLQQSKGSLLQSQFVSNFDGNLFYYIIKSQKSFLSFIKHKRNYTSSFIQSKQQNGGLFFANEINFIYFQIPFMIFLHFLLWIIFRIFFKYKISVCFRRYCFLGLIVIMVFQGNLEEFSYYILHQFHIFFSKNLWHKITNIILILFGFYITLFAFGIFLYFKRHYGKMIKYLVQDIKLDGIMPFLSYSVEKGIIPLFSAFIHFYFMQKLFIQSVFLIILEIFWIFTKLYCLFKCVYLTKFRVIINILNCLVRITLLITLYLFQINWEQNTMNQIHLYIGILYIFFWILDILITIITLIIQIFQYLKRQFLKKNRSKRVADNSKISKKYFKTFVSLKGVNQWKHHEYINSKSQAVSTGLQKIDQLHKKKKVLIRQYESSKTYNK